MNDKSVTLQMQMWGDCYKTLLNIQFSIGYWVQVSESQHFQNFQWYLADGLVSFQSNSVKTTSEQHLRAVG